MRFGGQGPGARGWGIALAAALSCTAFAASLPESIDQLLASSAAARGAFWGICVVNLETGATVYELNPDRFFVPASNTKLFTAALALNRLGPDFRFRTRVLADGPPDASGNVHGPLRLVGGGDPDLSARSIPYRMGPITGNPLEAIEYLADEVAARGVKRVSGGIAGDDTWYVWEPYAGGWAIDDPLYDYGAPVSALTINDNYFDLTVAPGKREGDPAVLALDPPVEYYAIDNRVRTVAAGGDRKIRYERDPGGFQLRLWGAIPLGDAGEDLALGIEDPALYAARAFRRALEARGIEVAGGVTAKHLFPNQVADLKEGPAAADPEGYELASRVSPPLVQDLQVTAKVSQNLHAELALRAVGRARRNAGSREAGLEEMKAFLAEAGIEPGAYSFQDGSGLSRPNLVTPSAVVALLRYMYASPLRESWISLLPAGGVDGTLSTRFSGVAEAGRIHAKTGSLSHVAALSGYIERPNGEWVAFSILVNNFNAPSADVRGVMDRIGTLILE